MKVKLILPVLVGICLTKIALGQVLEVDTLGSNQANHALTRECTIGLDVFKNFPYLLLGNVVPIPTSESARLHNRGIAEIVIRKQATDRRHWVGLLGYSKSEIVDPNDIERRQEIAGWYGKGGAEWTLGQKKGRSKLGIRGTVSYTHLTLPTKRIV